MIGQTISHYKILEKLGEGGMGVVYKAQDTKLLRPVALKFLSPDMTRDEDAKRRFIQEARAASALDHPNIAIVHEINETSDGHSFICMAYYEGQTLKARMAKGPMSIEEATRIVLQIANGLQRAHESKIVHRDIKPGNIIITGHGDVKIVDFGLAKLATQTRETMTKITGGTAAYMSPEQITGNEADARSDLFSLGVVFYEAVTGRRPFLGEHEAALFYSIANAEPVPPTTVRGDIPQKLEKIILRLLQKDPKNRYQSAADLREDLRRFLGESPTPRPVRLVRKVLRGRFSVPLIVGTAIVIGIAILFASGMLQQWLGGTQLPEKKIIGVLPATLAEGDSSKIPLCDGLLATITSRLVRLYAVRRDLCVVEPNEARKFATAGDAYRGSGVTIAIETHFQWKQNELQTIIYLVDARSSVILDSRILHSPPYVSSQLESDVIAKIAEMMKVEVKSADLRVLSADESGDQKAYEFYLLGRGYLSRYERLQNITAAIDAFDNALKKDSTYALAYAGLGEAYWRRYEATRETKWTQPAANFCQRALELGDALAPVHVTTGIIHEGSGRYEQALQQFMRALALDSLSSDANRGLAKTYEDLNDISKAEETYARAIKLNPGYWAGYNDLGVFYHNHGNDKKAAMQFERIIELTPDNYRAYNNLGGIYFYLERWDDAQLMFEKSIAIEPKNFRAYSQLGTLCFYQGRFNESAKAYESALKIQDTDYRMWGFLASAYQWSGADANKVRELFRKAIAGAEQQLQVNSRDPDVLYRLAEYHAYAGDRKKGLELLQQALRQAPEDVRLMGRAGMVYEELGDRLTALKLIAKAKQKGFSLTEIDHDPAMKALRADPRYAVIQKGEIQKEDKK